jgi:undecaprenyl-diphosphatase
VTPLHGLVLGIVQGLAEFLPISSSAHLILVPWLLGWPEHTLTFDVALHMGTLAALLVYFWRDWWRLIAAWLPENKSSTPRLNRSTPGLAPPAGDELVEGISDSVVAAQPSGRNRQPSAVDPERALNRRLGIALVVATIPAALIGALFSTRVEDALRSPIIIGLLMIAAAALLAAADRAGIKQFGLEAIGNVQAGAIGIAQALALAPGVSRSGVTLAAALFLGLTRESAARFVFLMAAPITAGAGLFQLRHLASGGVPADERAAFVIGIAASFAVGMFAIGVLLRYLRTHNLDIFVVYRIALGILVLLLAVLRVR